MKEAFFSESFKNPKYQYSLVSLRKLILNSHSITHHPKKKWHKRRALTESVKILNIHIHRKPIVCDKEPLSLISYIPRNKRRSHSKGDHDDP